MRFEVITVDGERCATLETVATWYAVEVVFVREVVELGVLGTCAVHGTTVAIPLARLDRLAAAVRLVRHHGLAPEALEGFLPPL